MCIWGHWMYFQNYFLQGLHVKCQTSELKSLVHCLDCYLLFKKILFHELVILLVWQVFNHMLRIWIWKSQKWFRILRPIHKQTSDTVYQKSPCGELLMCVKQKVKITIPPPSPKSNFIIYYVCNPHALEKSPT